MSAANEPRHAELSGQDPIASRWLTALQSYQPGLPRPVAEAMVEGAAKGELGVQLRRIEEALVTFENAELEGLTGSEVRVTIALLGQMQIELGQLQSRLSGLWERN
jgi:hypothetical protein